jgi:hypothetical protein
VLIRVPPGQFFSFSLEKGESGGFILPVPKMKRDMGK